MDLWQFGKPKGEGGPWKDTAKKPGAWIKKHVMTGYDKKTLTLKADKSEEVALYIDVNHYLVAPMSYKNFTLKAGEEIVYEFPGSFSAHWKLL